MTIQQRSAEWFAARLGKVTASRVSDVMATIKSGESASRRNYRMELLCERLTGKPGDFYTSKAMQRGIDLEAQARMAYWIATDREVQEVGFCTHPRYPFFGASPDGFVGPRGLIEIKCPETSTHVKFLQSMVPDPDYVWQMQAQMSCTGRQWCDFASFDDRLPEELQLAMVRVRRDPEKIANMITEIKTFTRELDDLEKVMRREARKRHRKISTV